MQNELPDKQTSLRKLTLLFASGNLISMALRVIGGFLVLRYIDPSSLGLFNSMGLVLKYAPLLQVGVLHGLNRELSYLKGRGEHDKAMKCAAAAKSWSRMTGIVLFCVLLLMSLATLFTGRFDLAAGWFVYAVSAYLYSMKQYLQIIYRSTEDFTRMSFVEVIQYGISIVLIALVNLFGFYGLCLRTLSVNLINFSLLSHWRPTRIKALWNPSLFKHLIKIGAPIFIVAQVAELWLVLDSTLVLKLAGTSALGLYVMAVMIGQSIELLPSALLATSYPRMALQFGLTHSTRDMLDIIRKPLIKILFSVVPICIVSWFLLPVVIKGLVPKYIGAQYAAQWWVIAAAITSLAPLGSILNIANRPKLYLIATISGFSAYLISLMSIGLKDVYLAEFPQSIAVGRCVCYLMFLVFVLYLSKKDRNARVPDHEVLL